MSLLERPEAQALLADAVASPDDVRGYRDHLMRFLNRYLPLSYRLLGAPSLGNGQGEGPDPGLDDLGLKPLA